MMTRRQFLGAGSALLTAACAPVVSGLYDSAPLDDPVLGRCAYSGRFTGTGTYSYEESDYIRAFFEPGDLAAYRQAILSPLVMPERPLVRVSVIDFYKMAYGSTYLESEISLMALHGHQPGWFLLTMPLTDGDACLGGRTRLGTPKVMRRVTLARGANRYVGTSFGWGGRAPDFTLTVDVGERDEAGRDVLRFALLPYLTLLGGRVLQFGGFTRSLEEVERAGILTLRHGQARLEFPREPANLLHRLGVGRPLAAHWARLRLRYSITPR